MSTCRQNGPTFFLRRNVLIIVIEMHKEDDGINVIVVGDHAVGKSYLVHWLQHGCPPSRSPRPTVGCNLTILESFGIGYPNFCVEICEIGGHEVFMAARSVLLRRDFDAAIIVYDANSRIESPEKKWIEELKSHLSWGVDNFRRDSDDIESNHSAETLFADRQSSADGERYMWIRRPEGLIPLLIIANKIDLIAESRNSDYAHRENVVFLSTRDPHLDTHPFHDFFIVALRHKEERVRSEVHSVSFCSWESRGDQPNSRGASLGIAIPPKSNKLRKFD